MAESIRGLSPDQQARLDALAILSPHRLLDYAETWRHLARQWTEMAKTVSPEVASKYRRTAQTALFAAYEADELSRRIRGEEPLVRAKLRLPRSSPSAAPADPMTGDLMRWL